MIHQYVSNGYHIVLDVNSGCVHVVDETAYRVIPVIEEALAQNMNMEDKEALEAYVSKRLSRENGVAPDDGEAAADGVTVSTEGLKETIAEILELYHAGMLYTEDAYEKYIGEFKNRQTVVKALCLHIAHDCNLACRYCFERS